MALHQSDFGFAQRTRLRKSPDVEQIGPERLLDGHGARGSSCTIGRSVVLETME